MNLEKVKSITNRIMDVNRKLADLGEPKIPINFIGMAGVGKTSSLMQVAEERGCHMETVVLSQLEEVGDITGMPVKFYKLIDPQGQEVEMAESVVPTLLNSGYTICPNCEPVTSFAKPSWVPEDLGQEFILLLDDFTRKN